MDRSSQWLRKLLLRREYIIYFIFLEKFIKYYFILFFETSGVQKIIVLIFENDERGMCLSWNIRFSWIEMLGGQRKHVLSVLQKLARHTSKNDTARPELNTPHLSTLECFIFEK